MLSRYSCTNSEGLAQISTAMAEIQNFFLGDAYNTVLNFKFKVSFEQKPHQIPPLGIRIQPDLHAVGFLRRNILEMFNSGYSYLGIQATAY